MSLEAIRPAGPFSAWERSIAIRYLRAKKKQGGVALVSIISFIGVMLAVAVLISVMSIMNGFRAELFSKMLGFNPHLSVQGSILNSPYRPLAIARIKQIPGVVQVSPMVEAQAMVSSHGQITGAIVRGLSPADLKATKLISDNIKSGSLQGFGDGEYGGDIILIGDRMAAQMGVQAGDSLSLISPSAGATVFGSAPTEKSYTIGGVFSVGMSQYDQVYIYMPLEQAQILFGRDQAVDTIDIRLADPEKADQVRPKIAEAVGAGGVITDWRQSQQSFFNALQVERNAMRLILMLIVAIAAMNIISGLVMLVKNKGRDIAILRTMGAGQGSILRIFFMDGAAIGVLGTLAGLVVGVLFCTYIKEIQAFVEWATGSDVFNADIYFLSHIPAKIDWGEAAIVTFWSTLMSFLATLPPAWRASRLDPVEALRYE
jgi:lipoprotein-releasing system permease protein